MRANRAATVGTECEPLLPADRPILQVKGISIDMLDFSINDDCGQQIGWISPKQAHTSRKRRSMSEPEDLEEGRKRFLLGSALKQSLLAQRQAQEA